MTARPRLSVSFACKTMSSEWRYSLDLPLFSVRRIFNLLWVNDLNLTFQFKKHVNKSIFFAKYFAILLPDNWCLSVAIMTLSGDKSLHNCTDSALPTLQHPSISLLLNNSPRLLPPRPTCIQKGKYQRSCLSLLSTMNLFSKAVYSIVKQPLEMQRLSGRLREVVVY